MSSIAPDCLEANIESAPRDAGNPTVPSGEAVARPPNNLSGTHAGAAHAAQGPSWKAYNLKVANGPLPGGSKTDGSGASTSITATDVPVLDVASASAGTRNAQATLPSPPPTADLSRAASTPSSTSNTLFDRATGSLALSPQQARAHAEEAVANFWSDSYAQLRKQGKLPGSRLRSTTGPATPQSGASYIAQLTSPLDLPILCRAAIALAPEASRPYLRIICADLLNKGVAPELAVAGLNKYLYSTDLGNRALAAATSPLTVPSTPTPPPARAPLVPTAASAASAASVAVSGPSSLTTASLLAQRAHADNDLSTRSRKEASETAEKRQAQSATEPQTSAAQIPPAHTSQQQATVQQQHQQHQQHGRQQQHAANPTHPQNPDRPQSHPGTQHKTQPAQIPVTSLNQAQPPAGTQSVQKAHHDAVQPQAVQQNQQQRHKEAQPAHGNKSVTGTTHGQGDVHRRPPTQQPSSLGTPMSRQSSLPSQSAPTRPAVDSSGAHSSMRRQPSQNSAGQLGAHTPGSVLPHGSPHDRELADDLPPAIEHLASLVQNIVQASRADFDKLVAQVKDEQMHFSGRLQETFYNSLRSILSQQWSAIAEREQVLRQRTLEFDQCAELLAVRTREAVQARKGVENLSAKCVALQKGRGLVEDNANLTKTIGNMTLTAAELKDSQASLVADSVKLKAAISANAELERIQDLDKDVSAQQQKHAEERKRHVDAIVDFKAKLEQGKAAHAQEVEKIKAEDKEALEKANAAAQQAAAQQVQEVVVLRKELEVLHAKVQDLQYTMELEKETNDELLTELNKAFSAREVQLEAGRMAAIAKSKEHEVQAARKDHEVALQVAKVKDLEQEVVKLRSQLQARPTTPLEDSQVLQTPTPLQPSSPSKQPSKTLKNKAPTSLGSSASSSNEAVPRDTILLPSKRSRPSSTLEIQAKPKKPRLTLALDSPKSVLSDAGVSVRGMSAAPETKLSLQELAELKTWALGHLEAGFSLPSRMCKICYTVMKRSREAEEQAVIARGGTPSGRKADISDMIPFPEGTTKEQFADHLLTDHLSITVQLKERKQARIRK